MKSFQFTNSARSIIVISSLLPLFPLQVAADHGEDFLLVQDHAVPAPWHGHLTGGFDWSDGEEHEEFSVEPGVTLGVIPRVSFSVFANFSGEGFDEMDYSSVTPSLKVQLTPPDSEFPLRVALAAGYEIAGDKENPHPESSSEIHADHDHETEHHAEEGHGHGHGHHGEEVNDHSTGLSEDALDHGHSGIHAHGTGGFRARLILEGDLGDSTRLAVNIINVIPEDGDTAWGYAAGLRHAFHHDLAVGIEAMGDFESDARHEVLGGVYWSPVHELMFKFGVGTGLTSESPNVSIRGGLVWKF